MRCTDRDTRQCRVERTPTMAATTDRAAKAAQMRETKAAQEAARAEKAAAEKAAQEAAAQEKAEKEAAALAASADAATAALVTRQTASKKADAFTLSKYVVADNGSTVVITLAEPLTLHIHEITADVIENGTPTKMTRFDVNLTGVTSTHAEKDEKKNRSWTSVDDTLLSEPQALRTMAVKYAQRNCAYRAITDALTPKAESVARERVTLKATAEMAQTQMRVLMATMQKAEPNADDLALVSKDAAFMAQLEAARIAIGA